MQQQVKLVAGVCAAMLLIGAPRAHADAKSDAQKAIQSAYNKADAAGDKRDVVGVLAFHSPDYYNIDKTGKKHGIGELKTQLAQIFQVTREIHSTTIIQSLSLKGSAATAIVVGKGSLTIINPNDPKQTAKLKAETKSEDQWAKTPQGWRLKSSKEISSKQSLNGKPVGAPKQ